MRDGRRGREKLVVIGGRGELERRRVFLKFEFKNLNGRLIF